MSEPWNEADDVIEEVREIRHRISTRFDHDPMKLVEHYIEQQRRYENRLLKSDESQAKGKSAA